MKSRVDCYREGFFTSFNCKPKDKAGPEDGVQSSAMPLFRVSQHSLETGFERPLIFYLQNKLKNHFQQSGRVSQLNINRMQSMFIVTCKCGSQSVYVLTYNLLNRISPEGDLIQNKFEPHEAHATILKVLQCKCF